MKADWIDTTLGDIAQIVSGATPKTGVGEYWNGKIAWATPKDLSKLDSAFIEATPRNISANGLKSCAATILPAHSVLLSSRAPIGLVAINTVPMATNQGFKSFVPDRTRIDSKFLYWWLRYHRPQLEAIGNGATFKEISKRIVAAVRIDLPPIVEQRRIASMLDAAELLRAKRREALAKLDLLTRAIFVEMFGDTVASSSSLRSPLGDLADVVAGGTPRRSETSHFDGDIPWVKIGDMLQGRIVKTEECLTRAGLNSSSAKVLPAGTLLFSIFATIGRTAILDIDAATNQAIAGVLIRDSSKMEVQFLRRYLEFASAGIANQGRGVAQANINLTMLRSHTVPLPPLERQQRFKGILDEVETLGAMHRQALTSLDALFASLRQRAFRGEL